ATTGCHALGADALGVGRLLCGIAIAQGDTVIVGGGQIELGPAGLAPGLRPTGTGVEGLAADEFALIDAGIGTVEWRAQQAGYQGATDEESAALRRKSGAE